MICSWTGPKWGWQSAWTGMVSDRRLATRSAFAGAAERAEMAFDHETSMMKNQLLTKVELLHRLEPTKALFQSLSARIELFERCLTFRFGVMLVANLAFWTTMYKLG
jgi:hypothetical protein